MFFCLNSKGENHMFFDKLKEKLNKTKQSFDERINNVVKNFRKVDEELLEELEEILIMSDIGVETSIKIISNLREEAKKQNIKDGEELKELLKQQMEKIFDEVDSNLNLSNDLSVILVIGVNGVGKTTSIGKIANNLKKQGKQVRYRYRKPGWCFAS